MKRQEFERTAIFRPGLLDREGRARPIERWFSHMVSSIKVSDVAKAMMLDAERHLKEGVKGTSVFSMGQLQKAAKHNRAP